MEEFKISLAAARVNADLTQEGFARAVGVSKATVVAWESGKQLPNIKWLPAIEKAVGISANRIRFVSSE